MRRLLKIGEAAALAGVTSKAIRHYHKVGLLAEPRRSESGYRLYGAEELLRLARIRRLRTLGLSLKQIKRVLGDENGGHSLREALSVLHAEVTAEIGTLEERRTKIGEALAREDPDATESSTDEPEALRLTKDILGDQFSGTSSRRSVLKPGSRKRQPGAPSNRSRGRKATWKNKNTWHGTMRTARRSTGPCSLSASS